MKKEDFCFTVGYSGETALVDKKSRSRYGKKSVSDLLAEGLYKPAFCSALYDQDDSAMTDVLASYNKATGSGLKSTEDLKKVFGVYGVPQGIKGTTFV